MATGYSATDNGSRKRKPDDLIQTLREGPVNLKRVPPYHPKQEQELNSVVLSKEFIAYEKGKHGIRQLLTEPRTKSGYNNNSIQGLLEMVKERTVNSKSEEIVLCLTGPMNTGKSATLNSLFQVGPIAREGDEGCSCTLASGLYLAPKQDQEEPFVAEVTFFSPSERRDILSNYLASYHGARHGENEKDDAGTGIQQDAEDVQANLDIRKEVTDALLSLFGDQPECSSKEAVREFLDSATSQDDQAILRRLFRWADTRVRKATEGNPVVTVSASTAGELVTNLENFTTHSEDESGKLATSLTPLVSVVKFHFDDPLTRLGIVFLDTPGTSDYNRTRKISATKCRKMRTHSAILSDEARVRDDSGISKEVNIMRKRGVDRSVIIITRSDLIKPSTIPNGSKKDKDTVRQLKKLVERLENELNAVELEESHFFDAEDDERACQLSKEKRILEMRLKLAQNAEIAHRINMRSEYNKKILEEKFEDISPTPVDILSISNTEYATHVAGFKPKDTPVLTVEQTNIPALRRIIAAFPNEARLNEIKHQQEVMLPGLLSRIRLYTARKASDRKADMEVHVKSPLDRYISRIEGIFKELECAIEENVLGPMKVNEASWSTAAGELCDEWREKLTTTVFRNLLNRNGRRKGSVKNKELNLSADLIHINSAELTRYFHELGGAHHNFGKDMEDDFRSMSFCMLQAMKDDSSAPFMWLEPFYDYVNTESPRLFTSIEGVSTRLLDGIDEIRRKAVSEDEDAYLVEAMLPLYAEIRELKGGKGQKKKTPKGGWPAHRHVIIKQELTKLNGMWATVCDSVKTEIYDLLETEKAILVDEIGGIFCSFYTGFDMMCEAKESDDPTEKKVRAELEANAKEAEKVLKGPMQAAYDALEKAFR